MTWFISLAAISLATYFVYILYDFFTYWSRQGLKQLNGISIGWAFQPFHEFLQTLSKNGKIYGLYGLGTRVLVINDPKMAHEISIKELHKFPLRTNLYLGKSSLNHSLFFMTVNDNWKRVRSIVSPAFTSGKLKGMLTPINRIVESFLDNLEQFSKSGEEFDMKIFTSAFTMDVIASCAYGINIDSIHNPNHPIVEHAKRILSVDASLSRIICFQIGWLGKLLNLSPFDAESVKYFDDLTFKIINERSKENDSQSQDLIGLIMEQTGESGKGLKGITREEIAGQGIIFFLAGYDTTNVTLCHTIFHLVKYPEWQDRLLEELKKQKLPLSYDSLRDLPVLNAIINETLRLFPPVVIIQRATNREVTLLDTGIKVPANTAISFHVNCIQRDPDNFPDPNSFKPERFIDGKAESNPAFMPFGVGPRTCVGMRFALNELRVVISQLILNYKLLPNPNIKLDYYNGNIILSPKKVMIRIEKRNDN